MTLIVKADDDRASVILAEDVTRLRAIMRRLYSGRIVTYDERRELAAQIDGILRNASPCEVKP